MKNAFYANQNFTIRENEVKNLFLITKMTITKSLKIFSHECYFLFITKIKKTITQNRLNWCRLNQLHSFSNLTETWKFR